MTDTISPKDTKVGEKRKAKTTIDTRVTNKKKNQDQKQTLDNFKEQINQLTLAAEALSARALFQKVDVDVALKLLKQATTLLSAPALCVFYITVKFNEQHGWCIHWISDETTKQLEDWLEFQVKLNNENNGDSRVTDLYNSTCGRLNPAEFKLLNWNGHISAPKGTLDVREIKTSNLDSFLNIQTELEHDEWMLGDDEDNTDCEPTFYAYLMYNLFTKVQLAEDC